MTKTIPLSKGLEAIVDDSDYERVKHYLGLFKTEWEAALAYNRFGTEYLGEGNFEPNIIDLD